MFLTIIVIRPVNFSIFSSIGLNISSHIHTHPDSYVFIYIYMEDITWDPYVIKKLSTHTLSFT